ncbi:MAG TPA: pyruvate, water dikinase regulatory protein [Dongiaceae bacterium]|jgi:regulator of PEP synthase PpsR (kinase-PPPase family)|nr:pyruvate, water dikinase regulatory protein [Dongiaceae bacterium]
MSETVSEDRRRFHLHLVSDATGETINSVARACLVQFEGIDPIEHAWTLIRTAGQMEKVLAAISANPGIVLFTIVNDDLRSQLREGCRKLQSPCIAVLEPVLGALAGFLGLQASGRPGGQHELDAEYFARIDAMTFALAHDDGQSARNYDEADVILVGVSRTSKTPTCIYLANRGIKAANVPIVPGCPVPPELMQARHPLVVGLTKDPGQLIQIRRNRLRLLAQDEQTDYVDPESVREEVAQARRLCAEHNWPVLDVTRRSIEETAAAIIQLLGEHRVSPPPK